MGISIQRRRGTTVQHATFTGQIGELTIDTSKFVAVIHDGSTAGGVPLAKETHTHPDATESVDGFLSAADKTKLDSITAGLGTNYQTLQANSVAQPQRAILNISNNFLVADDGAGNRTNVDLASSGVTTGTYTKVTVDAKGRVTTGALITAGDVPNLMASQITNFVPTVETVRLDQMTPPSLDLNLNNHKVINLAQPISATDGATKQYVDSVASGLSFKGACRAASTSTVNISSPGTSIDTVSLNPGDRVLLKDQTAGTQNGIYIFNGASTPLTRSLDANTSPDLLPGTFVLITEGIVNHDLGFVLSTTGTITLGTTSLTFVQFSSGVTPVFAGNGINVTNDIVTVVSANTNRITVSSSGVDLATIPGLTPGSYNQFSVDVYGRITATTNASYQPSATNLTALAALSSTGLIAATASGAVAARTLQPGAGIAITNNDGVAGNPQIGLTSIASGQLSLAYALALLYQTEYTYSTSISSNVTIIVANALMHQVYNPSSTADIHLSFTASSANPQLFAMLFFNYASSPVTIDMPVPTPIVANPGATLSIPANGNLAVFCIFTGTAFGNTVWILGSH